MNRIFAAVLILTAFAIAQTSHAVMPSCTPATSAASTAAAAPNGPAVTIDNFAFSPAALTVPAGTTVVWTNHDDLPHNIVERSQKFRSKALDTDDSFSYTFADAGTYEYFCGLHPKMVGKIIVEPKK
jgi:plastocyanin